MDLVRTRHDEAARTLVIHRGDVVIAANFSAQRARVEGIHFTEILLESAPRIDRGRGEIELAPESVVIGRTT